MPTLRLAIAGVGNCASALLQGLEYYRTHDPARTSGLLHPQIGGYRLEDLRVVAAFDVDSRKVGRPLEEAVVRPAELHGGVRRRSCRRADVIVQMGPVLDGVAPHMAQHPAARAFRVADAPAGRRRAGAARERRRGAGLLPAGRAPSARCGTTPKRVSPRGVALGELRAGVHRVGPELGRALPRGARSRSWATTSRARSARRSCTAALARLLADRGVVLDSTYQLNTGGNTDFLNMLEHERLVEQAHLEDRVGAVPARPAPAAPSRSTSARPTTSPGRRTTRSASSAWSGAASATCR